jgi:hypothetical protein
MIEIPADPRDSDLLQSFGASELGPDLISAPWTPAPSKVWHELL